MHKEILTKEQLELLPFIASFSKNFGLVGGTAVALHIGHRESIDFDMFSLKPFGNIQLSQKIKDTTSIDKIIVNKKREFTCLIKGVKVTFFYYPFPITFNQKFGYEIKLPDLLTLAAMKAYALGMREKWKDYVDLYFIIKDHYSVEKISKKAKEIFQDKFNGRMFRNQLAYFEDIDYSEKIIWMKVFKTSDEIIKKELVEFSLL